MSREEKYRMDVKKSSVLIHYDSLVVLSRLSDEEAGKLFRAIISYSKDAVIPDFSESPVLAMAFDVLSMSTDRNAEKYEKRCQINRENGAKGGRPKNNQSEKMETEKSERLFSEPKKPYGDAA